VEEGRHIYRLWLWFVDIGQSGLYSQYLPTFFLSSFFFSASFSPSFSRALGASDAKDSGFITEIVGLVGVV